MTYLIFLRLIHMVSGIFWAGSIFYLSGFVIPAVKSLGPDGAKFMQQLSKTNKLPIVMNLAGTLTILGGILLMAQLSNGFMSAWFQSNYGITLSIGATAAIIAYLVGFTMNFPSIMRMNAIGKAIAASGGGPNESQMKELMMLRKRLFTGTSIIAWLLGVSVVCMSIAQYV